MSDEACDDAETTNSQMIKRKISLGVQENKRLEKLADDYFGGNCSQAVRSAVLCYMRIKDGGGEARRQRIEHKVNRIDETTDKLIENLVTDDSATVPPVDKSGTVTAIAIEDESPDRTDTSSKNLQLVYHTVLREHPSAVSLDEIVSGEGLSEIEVRHALVELEMKGEVETKRIDGTSQVAVRMESAQ